MKMKDKVVIVTGAGTGIGQSACEAFAEEGADVVIAYNSSRDGAEETKRLVEEQGRRGLVVQCDASDVHSMQQLVREARNEFGRIDVMINNGVIRALGELEEIDEKLWDSAVNTNLRSILVSAQAVTPFMRAQGGGSIINVSSVLGIRSCFSYRIAYSVTKRAVMALTRSLAAELGQYNITVNCLCPGDIPTKNSLASRKAPRDMDKVNARIRNAPMQREGTLEEMNACLLFLANGSHTYCTGISLAADGGYSMVD